jgi:hypothetical protein
MVTAVRAADKQQTPPGLAMLEVDEEEAGERGGGEADAIPPFPAPVRSVSTLVTICRKKIESLSHVRTQTDADHRWYVKVLHGDDDTFVAEPVDARRGGGGGGGEIRGRAGARGGRDGAAAAVAGRAGGSFVRAWGREGSEWVPQSRGWRRDPLYRGDGEGFLVHGGKEGSG